LSGLQIVCVSEIMEEYLMKCPVCGGAELIHDTRDVAYTYKGQSTLISRVAADYCPACGEAVMGMADCDQYMDALGEFQREVDATYVAPEYFSSVCQKLGIDQREASRVLSGNPNSVAAYKNGRARPPKAFVILLKLLDRQPELLADLRQLPQSAMLPDSFLFPHAGIAIQSSESWTDQTANGRSAAPKSLKGVETLFGNFSSEFMATGRGDLELEERDSFGSEVHAPEVVKCPVCGVAELIPDTRDISVTYKAQTATIHHVAADYCPACGDSVLGAVERQKFMNAVLAFVHEVNASCVDPAFIAEIRQKLGLEPKEAAQILGGGFAAFINYEKGLARPPLALTLLLKLLAQRPGLISDVRDIAEKSVAAPARRASLRQRPSDAMSKLLAVHEDYDHERVVFRAL